MQGKQPGFWDLFFSFTATLEVYSLVRRQVVTINQKVEKLGHLIFMQLRGKIKKNLWVCSSVFRSFVSLSLPFKKNLADALES